MSVMSRLSKLAVFFSCSVIGISSSIASEFPHGCEVTGFRFQSSELIINEKGSQRLYMIQNHSNQPIELVRVETNENFMNPKLENTLNSMNWAAFASDIQWMHFKCLSVKPEGKETTNCAEVLDVCEYPRVKFALSNMGNYWISTNKKQEQVIKDAVSKGILLRW